MSFEIWTLLYLAVFLVLPSIGYIGAQSCGGNYTSKSGVFMSPNYPDVYNFSSQCTYRISLSTNSSIAFSFETFELDRSGGDAVKITCESNNTYVPKIYDWNSNIPPVSIPWCSSGRLYFHSDSTRYYSTRGFRVQYEVSSKDCGDTVFTTSYGTISSPNYPKFYNNDENCTYSIWASRTSSFTLKFLAFDLESDCQRDWVQIRCDNSSYILPKYCGSTLPKPAYINNCNKVLIWFHTDNSSVFNGFSIQYSFKLYGCGKSIYAGLSGIITSSNFPKKYNSGHCYCHLYPVSNVALDFQSFDLEPFIDIHYGDLVKIECYTNSSYGFRNYRGNTLPPLISYPLCSRVNIYFGANYALSGTGFSVKYQVNRLVPYGAIINAPRNIALYVNSQVQLDCTSNAPGYLPSWTLSRDGTDENTTVIASFCVVNPGYISNYFVSKGGQGVCNLVIYSATLAQAGVYTCIDVSLAFFSSVVTVLEVVSTVIKQPQVVKGDILTFKYSVKFNGSVAPAPILPMLFSWNSTGKSSAISNITLPNIVISAINVTAEPEVLPSYGFKLTFSAPINRKNYANNTPEFRYAISTHSYTVLYWPEESNMTITGDNNGYIAYNGSLQCKVFSNPSSSYLWVHRTYGFNTYGSYVYIKDSGTYTCNASNVIRGKTYWSSKSITVSIQTETTVTDSNDVVIALAVLLAIFGCGYIGLAIFCIVRRRIAKEGQRSTYQDIQGTRYENNDTTTSAPIPVYDDIPIDVLSPSSSGATDECQTNV